MKQLENDEYREGKQATKIVMTINDIENLIKSFQPLKNNIIMPRPMTKYKVETVKPPLHSFQPIRNGSLGYHKYGSLATFANRTQANNKCELLRSLAYDCYVTYNHPFLIILSQQPKF